ncbi:hypothetical protein ACTPD5_20930, partial [Clostridioides difficile]
ASGYLLKDSSDEVLHEGIRSSFFGNIVLDKSVAEKIMTSEKTPMTKINKKLFCKMLYYSLRRYIVLV